MKNIKIPEKFKIKMKEVQKEYDIIFLTAHTGFGKTCVVKEYLKVKKIPYTYIASEQSDFCECLDNIKSGMVVVDDFQNIPSENEEYLKNHLYELLRRHQVLIISRANMPAWLKPYQIIGQVGTIDASALSFEDNEVKEFFEINQVYVDEEELYQICETTEKYPLALKFFAVHLKEETTGQLKVTGKIEKDVFDYYDEVVLQNWSREIYQFVLYVGGFERFTLGLASMITGNPAVQRMIDEINKFASFLHMEHNEYIIEPFFRKYMIYKQKKELSRKALDNIYYNAGLYYELRSDIKNALKYYSMCGNDDKVKELLIRNSNMNPGIAQYLEVEEYYRAFPKEVILKTPDLMTGMSMLCSLNIQVEESEYWYEALKEYLGTLKKTDIAYKYVKGKLYWLDISLPHRGSMDVEKLILNAVVPKKNKEFVLQDISVTSNLPSALNGGKDFSCWIMKADKLYGLMKPIMPLVLGKAGEGLADICYAEKMLEQADPNTYQIINYINSSRYDASAKGKMETLFVGNTLMHRLYMAQGNTEAAYQLMKDYKHQVEEKQQAQLLPNLNALIALYYLRIGKMENVNVWMRNEAPNENKRFNVFERYRYMVKARCYIAQGKYMETITLLNRLIQYGTEYDRTIIRIQARLLLAITLYRVKDEHWREILEEALLEAQNYQYIRMIAEEGGAVLPLLQEMQTKLDKDYKKKLVQCVKEQALIYPSYLKVENANVQSLTATERQVLKLLGRGMKNKEISEFLNISLNTVAYHTKNIYQKLGVNNRTQATNIAKMMDD